jgi:2-polyprenyl-3-methyl-5-hydroxy-6-metoxy-1,4-benzoquinol methylase
MGRLKNIVNHVRQGTLIKRLLKGPTENSSAKGASPVGNVYHGERAENYLRDRTGQSYWRLEQDTVGKLIGEFPEGIRVLDMPIGTGRFAPFYLAKNMEVFGLDASDDMIGVAKRELGQDLDRCNFEIGDALELPYENDYFDLVVCFRFLSHVLSYEQAKTSLGELARVGRGQWMIQFRVRRDDVPNVPPPANDEAMQDKLNELALKNLLLEAGLRTENVVPLEKRDSYLRAIFVCVKK